MTNLGWGFTAAEIADATGVEELTLMNDFEAVGFGLEVLLANRPEAFVRLSRYGKLPRSVGQPESSWSALFTALCAFPTAGSAI